MIVYTATQGRKLAPNRDLGHLMLCLSDEKPRSPWKWIKLPTPFDDPVLNAKAPKILPWLFFDFDECWWVDANVEIKQLPEVKADIAIHTHSQRDCIFDEAQACIDLSKDDPDKINTYISKHSSFPKHAGLWECTMIYRRNTPEIKKLCEDWWQEIITGTRRDQLSLPIVLERNNIVPTSLGSNMRKSKCFSLHKKT
jgi:hypothetical protein